jgi:hypothetical protein
MKKITTCLLLWALIALGFNSANAQDQTILSGENITLNNQTLTRSNITINNGGELRLIDCNLTMDVSGRITVNPGGLLIIVNTTINCANPNSYWEGILVEGNPSLPQNPTSNQGFVNISQSRINRARIALATRSLDASGNIFWGKTGGGIIIASNTTIRDCALKHVEFWSYKNRINGKEMNNISRFTNCDFLQWNIKYPQVQHNPSSNPEVLSTYSTPFIITLWDVKGVTFNGCKFTGSYPMNFNDPFDTQKAYHSPSGILAYDASVIIQDAKSIAHNAVPRRGLFGGMNVSVANYFSAINDDMVNINNCDFAATELGISHNGGTGSMFYRNNFWLNLYLPTSPYGSGLISNPGQKIYTDNAMGLLVEENNFTHQTIPGWPSYLYDALFSTWFATVSNNADRGIAGLGTPVSDYKRNNSKYALNSLQTQKNNTRLQVTCNTFNNGGTLSNIYAGQININPISQTGLTPFFGDCQNNKKDYNNVFGNIQLNQDDIYNFTTANPNLTYVIKTTELYRPSQAKSFQMNITGCNLQSVDLKPCNSNLPTEPNWELGIPNFDPALYAIKKTEVIDQEGIIADPNTSAQQKATAQATLDALLIEIGSMRANKLRYHQYMQLFDDQSEDHLEEIISFLESDNDLFSKKMLLGIYINHQQYSLAQDVLATLPTDNADDLAYKNLCALFITLGAENRNVFMLTETEENLVREIAYGETASAVDAQGILALVHNEVLAKHTEKYPNTDSIENAAYELMASQNSQLTVYPNPAFSQNITAQYETTSNSNNKQIKVYNYAGELMATIDIEAGQQSGEVIVNASGFETGLYLVHFVIDGNVVAYKTLSFVK